MEKEFQHNEESKILENVPYRKLKEELMYLATTSKPDRVSGISYLSGFLDKPTQETYNAGNRILRYLQGTKDKWLTYYKNTSDNINLCGYSDADWGTDKKTERVSVDV